MKKILILVLLLFSIARAEEPYEVWALCDPDSYVVVRESASPHGRVAGRLECGDSVFTDGKKQGKWLHLVNLRFEAWEGWVSSEFVVDSHPEEVNAEGRIMSNGRVAVRTSVNGKRKAWGKNGDRLWIYWMADEWAITDKGYIKTEFVELE